MYYVLVFLILESAGSSQGPYLHFWSPRGSPDASNFSLLENKQMKAEDAPCADPGAAAAVCLVVRCNQQVAELVAELFVYI